MRLSGKILENVINVNAWKYANQAYVVEGQKNDVYVQLVDISKTAEISPKSKVLPDNPLRYISQAAAIAVVAKFPSIDDASIFEITGTQPFTDDKSIWKFSLTSTQLPSSGSFQIAVTEDAESRTFNILNAIVVELLDNGGC